MQSCNITRVFFFLQLVFRLGNIFDFRGDPRVEAIVGVAYLTNRPLGSLISG